MLLRWAAATDNEGVYGYEIFRGPAGAAIAHHASVRAGSLRFEDARVLPGESYSYVVRPYDMAGNRGPRSPLITVTVESTA